MGDDGACAYHAVVTNGHTWHDAAILTNMHIRTDFDRSLRIQRTMTRRKVQLLAGHIAMRVVCDIDALPCRCPIPYLHPVDAADATKRSQNNIVAYNYLRSKRL